MLDAGALKDILHRTGLTRRDQLLLVLSARDAKPKQVAEVRELAIAAGLRKVKNWNVSGELAKAKGQAARTAKGWELTKAGKERVVALAGPLLGNPAVEAAHHLRGASATLKSTATRAFVDEAIACLEAQFLRAAVVLSWIGAVSLLYDHVVAHHLAGFNAEASRRDPKWKSAKTSDDLSRMKEFDFLNVLEALSILGKNVRKELQNALDLRNGCGHPNSLVLGPARVASHIETLILNVFQKF